MLRYSCTVSELLEKYWVVQVLCGTQPQAQYRQILLFATSVRCCGRIIFPEGILYDPRQVDGLLKMEKPQVVRTDRYSYAPYNG